MFSVGRRQPLFVVVLDLAFQSVQQGVRSFEMPDGVNQLEIEISLDLFCISGSA
jgi:hypothetical protein